MTLCQCAGQQGMDIFVDPKKIKKLGLELLLLRVESANGGVDPALEALCKKHQWTIPTSLSGSREREWATSRRVLGALLDEAKRLSGDDARAQGRRVLTSMSHSRDTVLAAAGLSGPQSGGMGVDLERTDREISESLKKRFMGQGEESLGLLPLEIWTVKEACFKADPDQAGKLVSGYRITRFCKESGEGTCEIAQGGAEPSSEFHFFVQEFEFAGTGWTLSVASPHSPSSIV